MSPRSIPHSRIRIIERINSGGQVDVFKVKVDDHKNYLAGLRLSLEGYSNYQSDILAGRFCDQYTLSTIFASNNPSVFPLINKFHYYRSCCWITMELFDNDLLTQYGGCELGWEYAAKLLIGPLKAICIMHDHCVFHRDVKPSNLLYKKGKVVLGDLGFVGSKTILPPRTRANHAVGTEIYMLPAILSGAKTAQVLRVADYYAWFLSWFELAMGGIPEILNCDTVADKSIVNKALFNSLLDVMPDKIRQACVSFFKVNPSKSKVNAASIARLIIEEYPSISDDNKFAEILKSLMKEDYAAIQ